MVLRGLWLTLTCLVAVTSAANPRPDVDYARALVEQKERERIALIDRLTPGVVCIYDQKQGNAGSGVLIDAEGYGLTNFHVVRKILKTRRGLGGLSDGTLYDLEVLGIDPTGDVAMFRLTGRDDAFPFCELGDSDAVRVGDTAIAMGNPFALSEDYAPTVTLGMVTGIHRYQKGTGKNLIYSDCIQSDAPINPGNSGGPLFNSHGRIVGINGRISINTRGRLNVGFAYAIASNQIRRFIPSLRAGLAARHGTLQATVEDGPGGEVVFSRVKPGASADIAGVRVGDRLAALDGVTITSANHFGSLMGTYPTDWPVVLHVVRQEQAFEMVARLDAIPPKLSGAFEVDPEVNVREVERVLRRFQGVVLGQADGDRPALRGWSIERRFAPGADGSAKPPERFDVKMLGDGPVRMLRRYNDGSMGRLVMYDDRSATWRRRGALTGDSLSTGEGNGDGQTKADAASFESPLEEQLILCSLYVFQQRLCTPVEALDLSGVRHAGADRRLLTRGDRNPVRKQRADLPTSTQPVETGVPIMWQVLEVVEWPIGEHRVARLGFDTKTFRLVRIDARHTPSGTEATIELLDYEDIGGLLWPRTITVRVGTLDYRDVLSGWELSP